MKNHPRLLDNSCFESLSLSISDDVTFLLPFSVFMLIEVQTPDNPSFLSRLSVTKVPWLHVSNKAKVGTSLSELQCLNRTNKTHILMTSTRLAAAFPVHAQLLFIEISFLSSTLASFGDFLFFVL